MKETLFLIVLFAFLIVWCFWILTIYPSSINMELSSNAQYIWSKRNG